MSNTTRSTPFQVFKKLNNQPLRQLIKYILADWDFSNTCYNKSIDKTDGTQFKQTQAIT